tara:strand:+ start:3018 stop:3755 length:738 start_codon:yes stop_codon:yes gene_type:complete
MSCNAKDLSQRQIRKLIGYLKAKKYKLYSRPHELNIISVRNKSTRPDKFDDVMNVFYKTDNNKWTGKEYKITTDPSTNYLTKGGHTSSTKGTAILPMGQYVDTWKIGIHASKYEALRQSKSICVYRDYNRDSYLDFNVKDKDCGLFGINIHRARANGADDKKGNTSIIGPYSAGCQVFQNYYCFLAFMDLCYKQRDLYGKDTFTYTLIDKWLEQQFYRKRFIFGAAVVTGLFMVGVGIKLTLKNK